MSTPRRPLGHGPQLQHAVAPQPGDGPGHRVRATEADVDSAPMCRPGGLEHLAQLRERGVLGTVRPLP
ncbi:hypothetical protein [Streptomyces sp. NBC_00847]|uniref:hypothetical protein n=1 Tax=Streptomyces sp. NBC_00847 TaxID=2975850 RepID=UPI00225E1830|nr:hypothetical protein [Streptomyces sp. NBC_00847]MCX4885992.1 hypothetical protein [Streptomyces sp. NBC_00847]